MLHALLIFSTACSHTHTHHSVPIQKVRLFSTVQDNIVDNLLEVTSAVTSRKLHSVLEYLTLTTTATLMPRASILLRLWEMVADPHVSLVLLSSPDFAPSTLWWLTNIVVSGWVSGWVGE